MTLTANREVDHFVDQQLRTLQVAAAVVIYKGALIGINTTGYARPLVAGDRFAGIAFDKADNASGANGAIAVRRYTVGDFELAVSGATVAHVGRPVFASADDTLSFTGDANSYVGTLVEFQTTGGPVVRIDAERRLVKTVTHVVDDLAAGADIAARAIHEFNHEAWIVGARVVNQATAAAGIDASNTCVVALTIAAASVVTKTYDDAVVFPAANAADDLGAITTPRAAAGDVLKLAVTNGATADPGPFLVEVAYV